MAEEKKVPTLSYKDAVKAFIKEYKPSGTVHYDELTNKLATPYTLDADKMDALIQQVEDSGIGVVGDDGGPTVRQMLAKERKEEAEKPEDRFHFPGFQFDPRPQYLRQRRCAVALSRDVGQ